MRRFAFLFLLAVSAFAAKPEYPVMGADIFDAKAPAETLIAKALEQAKREDKRVLLFFGANWCPWCRQLHAAFTNDKAIQAKVRAGFVLVYIDANIRNDPNRNAKVLERYGNPTIQFGLPVFVVLDRTGAQIATQETASLSAPSTEEIRRRVVAFLERLH